MLDGRVELKGMREIIISDELLQQLEALPKAVSGKPKSLFTPEEDAILLKYWGVKRQVDICKIIGKCVNACRDRYLVLTGDNYER